MDSLIPDEFVGRYVASADMMCATTSMMCANYDYVRAQAAYSMGARMPASEIQHQYEQRVKNREALRRKIEHERKIREAQKNPLNRLLRWLKKACGSPVIEI